MSPVKDAALEFRMIARKLGYTRHVGTLTYANPATRKRIRLLRVVAGVLTIRDDERGTYEIDLNEEAKA
jgi:hypothetical protein